MKYPGNHFSYLVGHKLLSLLVFYMASLDNYAESEER